MVRIVKSLCVLVFIVISMAGLSYAVEEHMGAWASNLAAGALFVVLALDMLFSGKGAGK